MLIQMIIAGQIVQDLFINSQGAIGQGIADPNVNQLPVTQGELGAIALQSGSGNAANAKLNVG